MLLTTNKKTAIHLKTTFKFNSWSNVTYSRNLITQQNQQTILTITLIAFIRWSFEQWRFQKSIWISSFKFDKLSNSDSYCALILSLLKWLRMWKFKKSTYLQWRHKLQKNKVKCPTCRFKRVTENGKKKSPCRGSLLSDNSIKLTRI